MRSHRVLCVMTCPVLLLGLAFGCTGKEKPASPVFSSEKTCIQGMVWMKNPYDASPARYPGAKVTVWRHGTDDPLAEAVTDPKGEYSVQVPAAGFGVDLRVWGLTMIRGRNHTCKATVNNIDLGSSPRPCGQDAIRIDIMTECEEYVPGRRHN